MLATTQIRQGPQTATISVLKYALRARKICAGIVPLRPNSKIAYMPGGVHSALASRSAIKEHFVAHPNDNYGIATGAGSGLVVIDIDGEAGRKSRRKLEEANCKLPKTVTVRTSRGHQLYFRSSVEIRNSAGKLGEGIDVRGTGGYVVGAGSMHPDGVRYSYAANRSPEDLEIARLPQWLEKLCSAKERDRAEAAAPLIRHPAPYALAVLNGERAEVGRAPEGQRNDRLNKAAFRLGQLLDEGTLTRAEAEQQLSDAGRQAGLDDDEIRATVASGLNAGLAQRTTSMPAGSDRDNDTLARNLAVLGETDTDNAQRFKARCEGRALFTAGQGWRVWDGKRWKGDTAKGVKLLAIETAKAIANEAKHLREDDRSGRLKHGRSSKSKAAIENMLGLAEPMLAISDDLLDANPWLLNTATGTVDLQTGMLRPHDPNDLITKITPIAFDPNAKCPLFKRFLQKITKNDRSLIRYLQRAAGHSLTASVREQVFFMAMGEGANGKSNLFETLRGVAGEYAANTPTETLMERHFDNGIPNDLARLKGVRLVTAVEGNVNRKLDEAKIKALTGGDPITARFLRQEFFTFVPVMKIWMMANDFPRVRSTSYAFWRRVHVIPFDVKIPESEWDRTLDVKLKAEYPGILAWAVRGCISWQKKGLRPPSAVRKGIARWRGFADHFKTFIDEVCIFQADKRTRSSDIFARYQSWCRSAGEQPVSIKVLNIKLREHNLTPKHTKRGTEWIGVKLKAVP